MAGRDRSTVIVGAGLVGALTATYLRRRGFAVDVYERGGDIRAAAAAAGRSINLVWTARGVRALERVGLAERAMELVVPVTGRMVHPASGEQQYQPYGRNESECNYSVSRSELNRFLIDEAESAGARFHFEHALTVADPQGRLLTFEGPAGELQLPVEAAIGTDGAASSLRASLRERGGFDETVSMLGHGYKEMTIPAAEDGSYRIEPNALHIWPRGERMLMALPNRGGSFTVTLYLPFEGERSFRSITDRHAVSELFEREFADAIPLIPDHVEAYLERPTGELGTVRCGPWNAGRMLLLGDAAHAIVPFFGQGMNSGFEDCRHLDELLADDPADLAAVFDTFSRSRKPDTDAIAEMALDNFVEMCERVADPAFLLRKAVEHRLEVEMPREYRSRYSMVMYSHIPFRVAQAAGRIQEELLADLCRDLQDPRDVDLDRARQQIRARLTPYLAEQGVRLDY